MADPLDSLVEAVAALIDGFLGDFDNERTTAVIKLIRRLGQ